MADTDVMGEAQSLNNLQKKLDEEIEGQHHDQHEEDALCPKKTNKQNQPPQLKARFNKSPSQNQENSNSSQAKPSEHSDSPSGNPLQPAKIGKKSIQAPSKRKPIEHIPCLYLPHEEGGNKIVLYFHGNAEDIGLAFDLLYLFGQRMEMHVLAIEYPGYGLYKTSKPAEDKIKEDSEIIYDYLTKCIGIKESDIILFGRSMGSGPTSYLSSIKNPHSLLLMSPYTSIRDAAKALFGWASFLSIIVYEKFRNIDMIKQARCPVFFLHGQMDTLIPNSHSQDLHAVCPMESYLHMPEKMDHNEFQLDEDLIEPFKLFIKKLTDSKKKLSSTDNNDNKSLMSQKPHLKKNLGEAEEDEIPIENSLTSRDMKFRNSKSLADIDTNQILSTSAPQSYRQRFSRKKLTSGPSPTKEEPKPKKTSTHFEIRHNYNLLTHCSKIDESFVDYMMDSERGNFVVYFDQALYEAP